MPHLRIPRLFTFLLVAASAAAQSTVVLPSGHALNEGNTSAVVPWARGNQGARVQFVYDSTGFSGQGVSLPVLINRLRFRADGGAPAWSGGSFQQVLVEMSSCPLDHLLVSSSFASNHGTDRRTVFHGPVLVQPGTGGTPGSFYVDVALTTPFYYDSGSRFDLTVDIQLQGNGWSGSAVPGLDAASGVAAAQIVDGTSGQPNGSQGVVGAGTAAVCEFGFVPAFGLYPIFDASPTAGTAPLTVQFTDHSFTANPGGITAWAWDLDGDDIIDSTLQHPRHTYGCGRYDVSLTVTAAGSGSRTLRRPGYIEVDGVAAAFDFTLQANNVVAFTDRTSPPASNWAWDFDGDGTTDSTLQHPAWTYPPGCIAVTAALTARRGCGPPSTARRQILVPTAVLTTRFAGSPLSLPAIVNLMDLTVTNPGGIEVYALAANVSSGVQVPFRLEVWLTPGTFFGNDTNPDRWRHVGTARGVSAAVNAPSGAVLDRPFYLPPGLYGLLVHAIGVNVLDSPTNGQSETFANAHLALTCGTTRPQLWGGQPQDQQVWNGSICYDIPEGPGRAGIGFYGLGCAGTLPPASQMPDGLPRLGRTVQLVVDRLPADAMLSVLGLDRRSSPFGPLPLDMTPVGAPGCFLRVRPDAVWFVAGQGRLATWSLPVPNLAALQGRQFFAQPLVFDASGSPLGAVMGDAWAGVFGQ